MQHSGPVGPLLTFADPQKEAAFQRHFTMQRCLSDAGHIGRGIPLQLAVAAKMLASSAYLQGTVAALESGWFVLLSAAAARRHPSYLRHRTALLGAYHALHFCVSFA